MINIPDDQPPDPGLDLPQLRDTGGYRLLPRDTAFVGVSLRNVQDVETRRCPLGFPSPADWQACCDELRKALVADGLWGADVRLKGTAGTFFSRNPDKPFPRDGADCWAQAERNRQDGLAAEALWAASPYATASVLPNQSFWDCRRRLGIDPEPSDYDIQISSDNLAQTLRANYPDGMERGRPIVAAHSKHYKHEVLIKAFPALAAWSARWQTRLGRQVNLAGFPSGGPANAISRFDVSDWGIIS